MHSRSQCFRGSCERGHLVVNTVYSVTVQFVINFNFKTRLSYTAVIMSVSLITVYYSIWFQGFTINRLSSASIDLFTFISSHPEFAQHLLAQSDVNK